jgi:hypothetical protein
VEKRVVTASVAILLITGGWFGFRRYSCQERSAAFRRRIENIRADAVCPPSSPKLGDPNLHLLHDLPIEIDLLHQHEIPASTQPATMVRDVESRLMSIGIEAYS